MHSRIGGFGCAIQEDVFAESFNWNMLLLDGAIGVESTYKHLCQPETKKCEILVEVFERRADPRAKPVGVERRGYKFMKLSFKLICVIASIRSKPASLC